MPKPGSGKSAPKPTASSGGKEKKERVIEALVPKPSDSFIDNSRDPRRLEKQSARPQIPLQVLSPAI